MWWESSSILIAFVVVTISGVSALADCPSADLTGDCFVDFEDFAMMANQWLTGDPCVPDDMVYIPNGEFEMGRHVGSGDSDELPVHTVLLDSFNIGRYEINNRQYCYYLNAVHPEHIKVVLGRVFASSDDLNRYPYCDTHNIDSDSQINYFNGNFWVITSPGRDMNNDPMVEVSWYGAAAYCNWRSGEEGKESCYNLSDWSCDYSKHGYRLPTEAEWEYAARGGNQDPYYRFPWGDTISHTQANYYSYWVGGSPYYSYDVSPTEEHHPSWIDGVWPYTSPVGSFAANGHGLYDMAGNVFEWCNSSGISSSVLRGGSWNNGSAYNCRVADRESSDPNRLSGSNGFRLVLDSE